MPAWAYREGYPAGTRRTHAFEDGVVASVPDGGQCRVCLSPTRSASSSLRLMICRQSPRRELIGLVAPIRICAGAVRTLELGVAPTAFERTCAPGRLKPGANNSSLCGMRAPSQPTNWFAPSPTSRNWAAPSPPNSAPALERAVLAAAVAHSWLAVAKSTCKRHHR
jgi:hypothetical protein